MSLQPQWLYTRTPTFSPLRARAFGAPFKRHVLWRTGLALRTLHLEPHPLLRLTSTSGASRLCPPRGWPTTIHRSWLCRRCSGGRHAAASAATLVGIPTAAADTAGPQTQTGAGQYQFPKTAMTHPLPLPHKSSHAHASAAVSGLNPLPSHKGSACSTLNRCPWQFPDCTQPYSHSGLRGGEAWGVVRCQDCWLHT